MKKHKNKFLITLSITSLLLLFVVYIVISNLSSIGLQKLTTESNLLINTPNKAIMVNNNNGKLSTSEFTNNRFMYSTVYDSKTKHLVATTYEPEESFIGLTKFNSNKDIEYIDLGEFGPINAVSYNGLLLMDSSQALNDINNSPITELGVFDLKKNRFIKKMAVNGVVQSIISKGPDVFLTAFAENGKSNVYTFNFKNMKLNKVLLTDHVQIPDKIFIYEDSIIGISSEEGPGLPINKNYLFHIKKGKVIKQLKLNSGSNDLVVFNDNIYVLYRPYNEKPYIETININDYNTKKISLSNNPTNISIWDDKLVIIDNFNKLIIFNKDLEKLNEITIKNKSQVFNIIEVNKK